MPANVVGQTKARVCFHGYSLDVLASGAARYVNVLASSMAGGGQSVRIITARSHLGFSANAGGKMYVVCGGLGGPAGLGSFVAKSFRWFVQNRGSYDLIHSVAGSDRMAALSQLIAKTVGKPIVHTVLAPPRFRWAYWGASALIFSHRPDVSRSWPPVHLVPPPIGSHWFDNRQRPHGPEIRVGFLGHPGPRKGFTVFARMMRELRATHPAISIAVAIGDEAGMSRRLVRERRRFLTSLQDDGLADTVDVLGYVDPREFLSTVDILVFPFQTTSAIVDPPLTIIEAMAAGTAVVTTDLGGAGRVIEHQINGLLIHPASMSDHSQFASEVRRLIDSPQLRATIVAGGRKTADSYDIRRVTPLVHEIYQKLVNGTRR